MKRAQFDPRAELDRLVDALDFMGKHNARVAVKPNSKWSIDKLGKSVNGQVVYRGHVLYAVTGG